MPIHYGFGPDDAMPLSPREKQILTAIEDEE